MSKNMPKIKFKTVMCEVCEVDVCSYNKHIILNVIVFIVVYALGAVTTIKIIRLNATAHFKLTFLKHLYK